LLPAALSSPFRQSGHERKSSVGISPIEFAAGQAAAATNGILMKSSSALQAKSNGSGARNQAMNVWRELACVGAPPETIIQSLKCAGTHPDIRTGFLTLRCRYELCVLSQLRECIRAKEIWVVGADRYRNPDDDLPRCLPFETSASRVALSQTLDPKRTWETLFMAH
jgi:hypothetical protein